MAADINVNNNNDDDNNTSLTTGTRATIAEGDNRNRDDGEDAFASTATTSAHR